MTIQVMKCVPKTKLEEAFDDFNLEGIIVKPTLIKE